jgi:transposase
MFYTGLDIHKKFIYATVLDEKTQIVNQGKFGTNEKELLDFLSFLPNKQVKIVLESCGIWQDIYEILENKGYKVILANPMKVKAIASAKIKTDKIDSEILAKLLKGNLIPETYVPPKEIRELREIVRHRQSLVKIRTSLKNQIHAIMRKDNIIAPVKDIFAIRARSFLTALKNEKINSYLKILNHIEKEIRDVKVKAKSIEGFSSKARLIQTMPGLGDVASYIILAEIGDISRFESPSQLCSYAGIVPSVSQTGDKCYSGRITKQGSKWLRWIFIQCANIAVNKPNRLQSYFYRLNTKKHRNVALTATARKMIYYMWHMLKNNQPYIDNHTSRVSEAQAPRAFN